MRSAILGNRLKIPIPPDAMCSGNFGRFHRRKFKIIANKDIKGKNTHLFVIYNSRLKPIILTDMVEKHYSIIAYYIY